MCAGPCLRWFRASLVNSSCVGLSWGLLPGSSAPWSLVVQWRMGPQHGHGLASESSLKWARVPFTDRVFYLHGTHPRPEASSLSGVGWRPLVVELLYVFFDSPQVNSTALKSTSSSCTPYLWTEKESRCTLKVRFTTRGAQAIYNASIMKHIKILVFYIAVVNVLSSQPLEGPLQTTCSCL